jgi:hypothetical protein
LVAWEQRHRENDAEGMQQILQDRLELIRCALTDAEREKLRTLSISLNPFGTQKFFAVTRPPDSQGKQAIVISAETIRSIGKVALAAEFATTIADVKWLNDYLFYMRSRENGEVIVNPMLASGLISYPGGYGSEPVIAESARQKLEAVGGPVPIARAAASTADSMLVFIIAHEVAHVLHGTVESTPEVETQADATAHEILLKARETPIGAPMLFLSWMQVMQGSNTDTEANPTHPLHHQRALAFSEFELQHLAESAFVTEDDRRRAADLSLRVAKLAETVARDPAAFGYEMNAAAAGVTLDGLRLFR